jgi:ABC-2 type transport system permease protein
VSATVAQERTIATERRLRYAIGDGWVLTKRNLMTYIRKPDLLVFSTIQPVMFVLLFVYVFGGAMKLALPHNLSYVDFLMPGIFVQTAIFAATQTGVGLADDLKKGLVDRFRSLPMARSAVLSGRTLADSGAIAIQVILMLIVAVLVGFRLHAGLPKGLLALAGALSVGYAFTWIFAMAGLSLKSVEAVQAASFTTIFPFVFASTAFVPASTFPHWLQQWSKINPVSIWVDTFRDLTLGHLNPAGENVVTHLLQSTAWFLAILVIFVPISVRLYRRT